MGDLSSEPSMEDILASIKKIISEDSDVKIAPPIARDPVIEKVETGADETQADHGILELDAPEQAGPEEVNSAPEMAPPVMAAPVAETEFSAQRTIVSPVAAEASRSAMASLANMLVKPKIEGNDTLEGLVREMLKPLLREWLDAHLPAVVERIVALEVARISGRSL
jgi:uncharacterized protein